MTYTIYGRPGCGYCSMARQLLEINSLPFKYIDIWAEGISKQDLAEKIGQPVYTVPLILKGEEVIGGFSELQLTL
ncbi:MAG: glutaredoxin [SAR86 cluster bacterium]|uniref:Glutaredoxin n=1 Tax=SAR86 cluster bacterium TaxID=2030880 RepID=A0A2A4MQ31_9GAMM|nr:MAG: glutaredoxin [SAR86 cluster bacterium]